MELGKRRGLPAGLHDDAPEKTGAVAGFPQFIQTHIGVVYRMMKVE